MNSFFINITKGLELKEDNESNANTLEDVMDAFNSHPSIERIRRTVKMFISTSTGRLGTLNHFKPRRLQSHSCRRHFCRYAELYG